VVYGYVGIIPLILGFVAIKTGKNNLIKYLLLLAFIFLFLSYGSETFMHSLAYLLVPKYSSFRLTAFLNYLVAFSLASLAGIGAIYIQKKEASAPLITKELQFVAKAAGVLLIVILLLKGIYYETAMLDAIIMSVVIGVSLLFIGLYILRELYKDPSSPMLQGVLIFLVIIDLFTLVAKATNSNTDIDPRDLHGNNYVTDWIRERIKEDNSRAFLHDLSARYNSANYGIQQIGGYYGLYPKAHQYLFRPFVDPSGSGWIDASSSIMDLAGVRYIATSKELDLTKDKNLILAETYTIRGIDKHKFMTPAGKLIPEGTPIYIYENLDRFPRAFLVTEAIVVNTDEETANLVVKTDFKKQAIVTAPKNREQFASLRNSTSPPGSVSQAKTIDYTHTEVTIETNSSQDSILVLSDNYYPGWRVFVDGEERELLKADVSLRGVFLEKGRHFVTFVYRPTSLYLGITVSLFTAVALAIITAVRIETKRSSEVSDSNKKPSHSP